MIIQVTQKHIDDRRPPVCRNAVLAAVSEEFGARATAGKTHLGERTIQVAGIRYGLSVPDAFYFDNPTEPGQIELICAPNGCGK